MKRLATPSDLEYLRARATVARLAVRDGRLSPLDALWLTVWPTAKVADAERRVNRLTIASRAYAPKLNR